MEIEELQALIEVQKYQMTSLLSSVCEINAKLAVAEKRLAEAKKELTDLKAPKTDNITSIEKKGK